MWSVLVFFNTDLTAVVSGQLARDSVIIMVIHSSAQFHLIRYSLKQRRDGRLAPASSMEAKKQMQTTTGSGRAVP